MSACLILWDVDHTLIELQRLHYDLYSRAFRRTFNRDVKQLPSMSGRTDWDSTVEVLTTHGIKASPNNLQRFWATLEAELIHIEADLPSIGNPTPGAEATLRKLSSIPDVFQSILTGNLRSLAERKLAAFGLHQFVDFEIGGYGEDDTDRAQLVTIALARLTKKYEIHVDPANTVLVGDTPKDVRAAYYSGVKIVAVATGESSMAELAEAGAEHVLADLSDTPAVVSAVLDVLQSRPAALQS